MPADQELSAAYEIALRPSNARRAGGALGQGYRREVTSTPQGSAGLCSEGRCANTSLAPSAARLSPRPALTS